MRKLAQIAGLAWAIVFAIGGAVLWISETVVWQGVGGHWGLIYLAFGGALPGLLLYRWGRGPHQPSPRIRNVVENAYPRKTAFEMGHVMQIGGVGLQSSPLNVVASIAVPKLPATKSLSHEKAAEAHSYDLRPTSRMRMPRNVRLFALFYFASFLIGITGGVLTWPAVWTTREVHIQLEVVATLLAIFLVLFFPFFFLAVWGRKNWARWVLLVEFVGFLPLELADTGKGFAYPMLWEAAQFVADAIEILAFYFLFTANARPWFSRENSK